MSNTPNISPVSPEDITRPSSKLLTYYLLCGILTGPGMLIAIPALIIRYNTLRYRVEATGIRMQVGLFFRNEVVVAFRRIQDIHVSRNLFQRWLGISSVSVQTASGSATPEIVLEGMTDPDLLRDWLYERMRGAKGITSHADAVKSSTPPALDAVSAPSDSNDEVESLLRGIRDQLAILARREASSESRAGS